SESCHGQAERLLDSAREMEDSISVSLRNLSDLPNPCSSNHGIVFGLSSLVVTFKLPFVVPYCH
ncbi:hypothetical protein A2U01_0036969, partial [Trifolium medium]|nr:hypothetical protein [Trifolium medium]